MCCELSIFLNLWHNHGWAHLLQRISACGSGKALPPRPPLPPCEFVSVKFLAKFGIPEAAKVEPPDQLDPCLIWAAGSIQDPSLPPPPMAPSPPRRATSLFCSDRLSVNKDVFYPQCIPSFYLRKILRPLVLENEAPF